LYRQALAQPSSTTFSNPSGEEVDVQVCQGVFPPQFFGLSLQFAAYVATSISDGMSVLEVGVGSGLVSAYLLEHASPQKLYATDIEAGAIECAGRNLARYEEAILEQADLFPSATPAFDVVVWNVPFFPDRAAEVGDQARSDLNFAALRSFLLNAVHYLKPGGRVFLLSSEFYRSSIQHLFGVYGYDHKQRARYEVDSIMGEVVGSDLHFSAFADELIPTSQCIVRESNRNQ